MLHACAVSFIYMNPTIHRVLLAFAFVFAAIAVVTVVVVTKFGFVSELANPLGIEGEENQESYFEDPSRNDDPWQENPGNQQGDIYDLNAPTDTEEYVPEEWSGEPAAECYVEIEVSVDEVIAAANQSIDEMTAEVQRLLEEQDPIFDEMDRTGQMYDQRLQMAEAQNDPNIDEIVDEYAREMRSLQNQIRAKQNAIANLDAQIASLQDAISTLRSQQTESSEECPEPYETDGLY
jgi:flagellar biosynthesis/type III secretory pathway chaperone